MSTEITTKKKAPVTANQFDDADEEEDPTSAIILPTPPPTVEAVIPLTPPSFQTMKVLPPANASSESQPQSQPQPQLPPASPPTPKYLPDKPVLDELTLRGMPKTKVKGSAESPNPERKYLPDEPVLDALTLLGMPKPGKSNKSSIGAPIRPKKGQAAAARLAAAAASSSSALETPRSSNTAVAVAVAPIAPMQKIVTTRPDPPDSPDTTASSSFSAGGAGAGGAAPEPAPPMRSTSSQSSVAVSATVAAAASNPLDALAFACVAEENKRRSESPPESPQPPHKITAEAGREHPVAVEAISCTDVLCGRGGQSNHHPGNIFFRRLVRAKQEEYLQANKREKTVVAKDIVRLTRMLTPPGRFLKKDPKDDNSYVDVGDAQARNKASQALREGAPELREELRDQHVRLSGDGGGRSELRFPYHGNKGPSAGSEMSHEGSDEDGRDHASHNGSAQAAAAQTAAARGFFGFNGHNQEAMAAAMMTKKKGGRRDPPESSGATEDGQSSMQEERARRFMMAAAGGPPGGGYMNAHMAGLGMGPPGAMNPYLGGSPAAQMQAAAAFQAAGGQHMFSQQQAMMMAGGGQGPAALMQATRARELASQMDPSSYASHAGFNPMIMAAQQRGNPAFQASMPFHEMMKAGGGNKREREDLEREIDENYAKAAKMGRQY